MANALYSQTVNRIDGTPVSLGEYQGKVALIVNVASACGLTPQYEGLEALYQKYHSRGFEILGFPANEFGAQEPGTNAEIQEFCQGTFGVKFPMFEKIVVKGEGQHPLYQHLTSAKPVANDGGDASFFAKIEAFAGPKAKAEDVTWNFEKFLVGKDGEIVERFAPHVKPDAPEVVAAIEKALG